MLEKLYRPRMATILAFSVTCGGSNFVNFMRKFPLCKGSFPYIVTVLAITKEAIHSIILLLYSGHSHFEKINNSHGILPK